MQALPEDCRRFALFARDLHTREQIDHAPALARPGRVDELEQLFGECRVERYRVTGCPAEVERVPQGVDRCIVIQGALGREGRIELSSCQPVAERRGEGLLPEVGSDETPEAAP